MKISFFELIFNEYTLSLDGFTQVRCPFPHGSGDHIHYDTVASAGVNVSDGGYHCFACGRKMNELEFIADYMNISLSDAFRVKNILQNSEGNLLDWKSLFTFDEAGTLDMAFKLGFSKETLDELNAVTHKGRIVYPVLFYGQVIDTVGYSNQLHPKILRSKGSKSGMIIPYDIWKSTTNKTTIICAGEKDMTIAREHGLNAITITGGEGALPDLFYNDFKDRTVVIIYDNDVVGRNGAIKVAAALKSYVKSIKIIDLSDTTVEEHEDLWDYFMKYNKTKQDLAKLIKETPVFTDEDAILIKEKQYPTVTISEALTPKYLGKIVRSNVQVTATIDNQFQLPTTFYVTKTAINPESKKNTLKLNETKSWFLKEHNIKDILQLIDSNLKEERIYGNKLALLGIPTDEPNIVLKEGAMATAYKCIVTDYVRATDLKTRPTEMVAFSVNKPLESGRKYKITYQLAPHPYDGQKLVMLITDVESVEDTISTFKVTPEVIETLKHFQVTTTLQDKINKNIAQFKGLVFNDYNDMLILLNELAYHSVLKYEFHNWGEQRGALDLLIVGESRTGKSHTAETLSNLYGVGTKVDMINTTKAGLIGGSSATAGGGYQTKAGILPMSHGGLVILEELGKAKEHNIVDVLTEVKSSGIARISRVNGQLDLPATVRMISITNPKTVGSSSKPIAAYPNGIEVIVDLLGRAENIARFDAIAIFAEMADGDIDLSVQYATPFPDHYYKTKISWVWSRTIDQIKFDKSVVAYTISLSNKLKNKYNTHIKIFGTETWKKVTRFAIAIAAYVVSTDENYEDIIVKKEHIDAAAKLLVDLYDNDTFRLAQYVEAELRLKEIDDEGVKLLQRFYDANPIILKELERLSETTKSNLETVSGIDRSAFSSFISELVRNDFVVLQQYTILPTERFRKGMRLIKRDTELKLEGSVRL